MGKNVGKNISKNLSGKYSQKPLDHAKKSVTDALKTSSKRVIQKTAEILVTWLVIKLLIELGKFQKIHNKNFQKQLHNDRDIPKERYIPPEKIQAIIHDLRLIY